MAIVHFTCCAAHCAIVVGYMEIQEDRHRQQQMLVVGVSLLNAPRVVVIGLFVKNVQT